MTANEFFTLAAMLAPLMLFQISPWLRQKAVFLPSLFRFAPYAPPAGAMRIDALRRDISSVFAYRNVGTRRFYEARVCSSAVASGVSPACAMPAVPARCSLPSPPAWRPLVASVQL